jgi:hypothetical protein
MEMSKDIFLNQLKTYIPADDYIMVGNIKGVSGPSDDEGAANLAGWRFIKESDFRNSLTGVTCIGSMKCLNLSLRGCRRILQARALSALHI